MEERALQAPVSEWEHGAQATYMLPDGAGPRAAQREQDPGWLEGALWTLLPGLPGKTGGRTGKHGLLVPSRLLCAEL